MLPTGTGAVSGVSPRVARAQALVGVSHSSGNWRRPGSLIAGLFTARSAQRLKNKRDNRSQGMIPEWLVACRCGHCANRPAKCGSKASREGDAPICEWRRSPGQTRGRTWPGIGGYNWLEKILPQDYRSLLTPKETQKALFASKNYLEGNFCKELNLMMVTVPLIVDVESGINDYLDRDGSRAPFWPVLLFSH